MSERNRSSATDRKTATQSTSYRKTFAIARRLISEGFSALPLCMPVPGERSSGKRPMTTNGVKNATKSLSEFEALVGTARAFNLGIATGRTSGIVVLDIDPRNGGVKTMATLTKELGALPNCPGTSTGGNGEHLFFNLPEDLEFNNTKLGPGVDVLANNSYVVAPPSRHASGKRYRWLAERRLHRSALTDLPAPWVDKIKSRVRKDAPVEPVSAVMADSANPLLIPEGNRNNRLTALAGKLRGEGRPIPEIEAELMRVNQEHCRPPLERSEVLKIVGSAQTWVMPVAQLGEAELVANDFLKVDYQGGEHLRFERGGQFYAFVGTHWEPVDDGLVKRRIYERIRSSFPSARKHLNRVANEALEVVRTTTKAGDDLLRFVSAPHPVINVLNGEIWLLPSGNHELRPHAAGTGSRHVLQCRYDADARCPLYDKAVAEIFSGSKEPKIVTKVWHEIMGYIMQPSRNIAMFVLLIGAGSNGKSGLSQTLGKLLGPGAVHSGDITKVEGNRFGLGDLVGKMLFLDDDVQSGAQLPDGMLKKLSEGKELTAERKHRDAFNFVNRAVPMLLTNHAPAISDMSHGLERRLIAIKFSREFKAHEQDRTLFERIWATELPGILNHALAGWKTVVENGLRLTQSQDLDLAKTQVLTQANNFAVFIDECCDRGVGSVKLSELYDCYQTWARQAGYRNAIARNGMKQKLEHLRFKIVKLNGSAAVSALRIKASVVAEMAQAASQSGWPK